MVPTKIFLEVQCMPWNDFKDEYKQYIGECSSYFQGGAQHCFVFFIYLEIEDLIIKNLKAREKIRQSRYARILQILILSIIKKKVVQLLLEDGKTIFWISIEWIIRFIKSELNWTIWKATTATSKLPTDWEQYGLNMVQCVAYLVKSYNIPHELMVNTDQTGIHLI